ncbi:MAG TPA: hypothetical protein VKB25_13750 [Conexibacter sp.]|nr:hypothetical protein [Conexibacter sp.]
MTSHVRTHRASALVALLAAAATLMLALPGAAHADQAYDKVANAYAVAGGRLDPCSFTQAELEAAVKGIPPEIRNAVPDLRRAIDDGIAAHKRGDCKGVKPEEGTTGGAAPSATTPTTTTPPVTTPPVTAQTAPAVPPVPAATTPTAPTTPTTSAPAPAASQPAAGAAQERDRTPILVALIAAGALVLLGLLLWGWARMRGWDPGWVARVRHGWGEAGFRTTSTWTEFTDWLRLGR